MVAVPRGGWLVAIVGSIVVLNTPRQSGIFAGAALSNEMRPDQLADLRTHFNALTTENAFKWDQISPDEGVFDFDLTDRLVTWARTNRVRIRAHNLFWHRLQVPAWVRASVETAPDPQARLRELMQRRVEAVVGRYRGKIDVWDVVNEPLTVFGAGYDTADSILSAKNFFYTTLGTDYIAEAFRLARAVDRRARLFLNETVWDPRIGDAKADAFLALVRDLKARGVPIHGVGIEAHGMLGVGSPLFPGTTESLAEYMEAFAALGLRVEITEMDVRLPLVATRPDPLAAQAEVFRRVVDACAGVRRCTGVTVWGLRDPDSWLDTFPPFNATAPNRPLLLDDVGDPKPAYFAIRDGLLGRCRSGVRGPRPCSRAWPRRYPATR
jgi:endo-1,4-beta-xylanase